MKKKEDFVDVDKAIRIAKEYGKWIPVDKKLPKRAKDGNRKFIPSSDYVAILSDRGEVFIAKYNFDFKTWIGKSDYKITHWKPIRNKKFIGRKLINFMWIPVCKKLPKEDPYHKGESKPCLVAAGKYGVLDAYYDFESNEWIFLEEECYISTDKITHWMPMPEAPLK